MTQTRDIPLRPCRSCKKEVRADQVRCPHCLALQPTGTYAEKMWVDANKSRSKFGGCATVFVIAALGVATAGIMM